LQPFEEVHHLRFPRSERFAAVNSGYQQVERRQMSV
jgi:hypothetical protein